MNAPYTPLLLSDEDLVFNIQQGQNVEKAKEELSKRYYFRIYNLCSDWLKKDPYSQDMVQELFMHVFLKIQTFNHKAKFSTWLYSVAHNKCIDHLRKNKKKLFGEFNTAIENEFSEVNLEELNEEPLLNSEALNLALLKLKPLEYEILLKKFSANQSIKEIAKQYNFGESKVKMILLRARKKLKNHLELAVSGKG